MDAQLSLFDTPATLAAAEGQEAEIAFVKSILPAMRQAIEAHGVSSEEITYVCNNAPKDPKSSHTTVALHGFTIFQINLRGKKHYIWIPLMFEDLIPDNYPIRQTQSDQANKYIRLLIDEEHPPQSYTDFFVFLTIETINRYPKDWDCCSRYVECSNAMQCVHPDKTFALACGYRKILKSGRSFYGNTRNV